jgi:hypothetical protein
VITPLTDLRRTSGSATNGTWTGTLTLPQGSPPGTYYLEAYVQDVSHWTTWMSPESPQANPAMPSEPVPGADRVTVVAE